MSDLEAPKGRGRRGGSWLAAVVAVVVALPLASAVAGLLLARGAPEDVGYGRQALGLEARRNLERLVEGVERFCRATGRLPPEAGPVPPAPGPRPAEASFATEPGFAALGFDPRGPVRFSYRMVGAGSGRLRLVATGDLDGDGRLSELSTTCQVDGCVCSPGLVVRDELE